MKTAILLSGHMRTYKKCLQAFMDKMVTPLDADIFVSTWDCTGFASAKKRFHTGRKDHEITQEILSQVYGNHLKLSCIENIPSLWSNFQRKNLLNTASGQPNCLYRSWNAPSQAIMPRFYSMCYKIKSCNELRKLYEETNSVKYDLIIRSRPDLLMRNFTLEGCDLSSNNWHIPLCENYRGWNDQFALGNSETMNHYCDVYESLDRYISENFEYSQWVEGIFQRHAKEHKIKKQSCPKIFYTIER